MIPGASRERAIVARITGGLGNQLFQYAAARHLATRHAVPLLLDLFHYAAPGPHIARRFELDAFHTRFGTASAQDVTWYRPSRLRRLLRKIPFGSGPNILRQQGFGFDPRVLDATPPLYLDGTWQSEKFFAPIADALRSELRPRSMTEPLLTFSAGRIPVSVHVRRGDYASDPKTRGFHGLLGPDYYERAMAWMREHVPQACFVIFSDEPDWASTNLRTDAPMVVMPVGSGPLDLARMAACRHHIIANSSFSWWGAWLNPDADKRVVAPERWFTDEAIDTSDLIPPSWRRM